MGLTYNDVRAMLSAKRDGASFDRVVTLGHQILCLHPPEVRALSRDFGLPSSVATRARSRFGDYSDEFFRECLETTNLSVLDASDYEGASLVHDLNRPVPVAWHQQFDAVVDGGTLEHIFDVPQGLANIMRLASVGGRIFSTTPANNLCGHGFYQFSPELMFRVFAPQHGFRPLNVVLVEARYPRTELTPAIAAYSVRDPKSVGDRVGLVSKRPVTITVEAEKIHHLDEPFAASPPQQSDYETQWREERASGPRDLARRVASSGLHRLRFGRHVLGMRQRWRCSFRNSRAYSRQRYGP